MRLSSARNATVRFAFRGPIRRSVDRSVDVRRLHVRTGTLPWPAPCRPSRQPLSTSLFERYRQELRVRNYSPRTIKAYVVCLRAYTRFLYPRLPRDAGAEDVRAFLLHSLETGLSRSYLDQSISALKFLYVELYGRPADGFDVPRPRREQALPAVPTREEVLRLAAAVENPRHRLAILLLYACGIRVSELVRARVEDVSVDQLTLHVRDGKGRKDRVTVVSEVLAPGLREACAGRPGSAPLVPARGGGRLTTRSIQRVVDQACVKAGIERNITPHSFRHAFATHVLEAGVPLEVIRDLLGHARIETTRRYTRVRNPRARVRSPL
jgi:integrase/recombinase XerD